MNYWFHTGEEFTTQLGWTNHDNDIKRAACEQDRINSMPTKTGKYTFGPTPGPSPCGKTVWLCNGIAYKTQSDYATTSCGAPKEEKKAIKKKNCANFKPPKACRGTTFVLSGREIKNSRFCTCTI